MTDSKKSVALYARVSTVGQDTENQLIELRRYVQARGWNAVEFVDRGISGAKGEDKRPALKSLMDAARKKQVDAVLCWDFSRFARSMRHLVEALDLFRAWGIAFISLREGIDTTTANGRLMFGIFASLAEFERELIRERVLLGLAKARTIGKRLGRPRVPVDTEKAIELKARGLGIRAIARLLRTSKDKITLALKAVPENNSFQGQPKTLVLS